MADDPLGQFYYFSHQLIMKLRVTIKTDLLIVVSSTQANV